MKHSLTRRTPAGGVATSGQISPVAADLGQGLRQNVEWDSVGTIRLHSAAPHEPSDQTSLPTLRPPRPADLVSSGNLRGGGIGGRCFTCVHTQMVLAPWPIHSRQRVRGTITFLGSLSHQQKLAAIPFQRRARTPAPTLAGVRTRDESCSARRRPTGPGRRSEAPRDCEPRTVCR